MGARTHRFAPTTVPIPSFSYSKKGKICDIGVIIAPQKRKTEDTGSPEIVDFYNLTKGRVDSSDVESEDGPWPYSVGFWMQVA
jgi:hypothetical protein